MKAHVNKAMRLIVRPKDFFKSVAKEKGYWTVLKFFVVIYVLAAILQFVIGLPVTFNPQVLGLGLMGLVLGILFAFIYPFIFSGVAHVGVWVFGGRKGFFHTFKAATYGGIILFIYGIIAAMVATLLTMGGLVYFNIINWIIVLAGLVHVFAVQAIGVSKFHGISRVRAFLGVAFIPLVLVVLWMVVFISLVSGLIPKV